MRLSPGACFLVLALALSIGACGEDEFPTPPPPDPSETPREQVAETVNSFFAAVLDGDAELACAYLSDRGLRLVHTVARRELPTEIGEDADCVTAIGLASEYLDQGDQKGLAEYTYRADEVSFTSARSKAYVQCEFRGAVFVRRSGDGWLLDIPACID